MIGSDRRVRIISGHYGSGKTEIAVNYAVKLAENGGTPVLADIDIINPYFRSRELAGFLESLGIRLIASSVRASAIDLPAVPAEIYSVFDDRSTEAVVDAGGDEAGAGVLNRFSDHFERPDEYDLFFVVNANRPFTKTAEQVCEYIKSIEKASGLRVSGLINNTHMLKSTSVSDVVKGYRLAAEVSGITGIPLRYNTGLERLTDQLPERIRLNYFPLKLYMREDWMS